MYIYIYIVQSTDMCFAVLQLLSVAWNNLNEFTNYFSTCDEGNDNIQTA